MTKIKEYKFGKIVVQNPTQETVYTNDIIICKDKIIKWWRKTSHLVEIEDLMPNIEKLTLKECPEIIIIGTGIYGAMKVSEEVMSELTSKGIKVIVCPTNKAIDEYNTLVENKKDVKSQIVGAFHLTC